MNSYLLSLKDYDKRDPLNQPKLSTLLKLTQIARFHDKEELLSIIDDAYEFISTLRHPQEQ